MATETIIWNRSTKKNIGKVWESLNQSSSLSQIQPRKYPPGDARTKMLTTDAPRNLVAATKIGRALLENCIFVSEVMTSTIARRGNLVINMKTKSTFFLCSL